jgi:type IV pilus assembly protein PilA
MRDTENVRAGMLKRMPRQTSGGFSLIELLIVVAVILIISGIAIPNLIRSKMAANEASATASMHAILTASSLYYENYSNGYPPTMASMGGAAAALPTCNAAGELEPLLSNAPNQKSGYTFAYTGEDGTVNVSAGCSAPGFMGFLATAVPTSLGVSGARSFCVTEDGVIHFDSSGALTSSESACDALPVLQ